MEIISTNSTDDSFNKTDFPLYLGIALITLAATPFIANGFMLVICLKALSKKCHNLLIMSLCFSDCIMALSYGLSTFSKLFPALERNIISCLFTIFTLSFSTLLSYILIFLICVERYFIVKSFNFGMSEQFENLKYRLVGGAVAFAFILAFCCSFLIPFNNEISTCGTTYLYGENFFIFGVLLCGPSTILTLMILITTFLTGRIIWKEFFLSAKNRTQNPMKINSISPVPSSSNQKRLSEGECQKDSTTKLQNKTEDNMDVISIIDNQNQSIQKKQNIVSNNNIRNRKSWEIKAFVTSVIVAGVTLMLTGPMIVVIWYDIFTDSATPSQTRFLVFILYIVNALVDPFIYSWRIPEIRQEFRRLFLRL